MKRRSKKDENVIFSTRVIIFCILWVSRYIFKAICHLYVRPNLWIIIYILHTYRQYTVYACTFQNLQKWKKSNSYWNPYLLIYFIIIINNIITAYIVFYLIKAITIKCFTYKTIEKANWCAFSFNNCIQYTNYNLS